MFFPCMGEYCIYQVQHKVNTIYPIIQDIKSSSVVHLTDLLDSEKYALLASIEHPSSNVYDFTL